MGIWPAEAQTTSAPPAACSTYACTLYDRDYCCRKTGWPWWGWLLLALGIFYCCHACCCPACAIPIVGGMGGKKKKKKKSKARAASDSDSSWSSDEYVVHPA